MGLRRWWRARRLLWQTEQAERERARRAQCVRESADQEIASREADARSAGDDGRSFSFVDHAAVARLQFTPSDAHVITLLIEDDQRRLVIPRDSLITVLRDNVWVTVGDVTFGRCGCLGRDHITFNIRYPSDNDRVTWLTVKINTLRRFVNESLRKVPQGQELRDVNLDDELRKLLAAGGEPGAG